MTDYGFTGSSEPTTEAQRVAFGAFLPTSGMTKFRHGDCINADADAHEIVRTVLPGVHIHGHPPLRRAKRAFCQFDTISKARQYFDRNDDIAEACEELLAMPRQMAEAGGGTWDTIRKARRRHKPVTIFWPDGSVTREENKNGRLEADRERAA
jgi:hypothetical protein